MADRTLTINHADGGSETYTINRDKFAGVREMSVDGDTVTVDHTAVPKEQSKETTFGGSKSITIKRDIEPLLSKVVGGASAAYSLRDLNDKAGNNKVVRVRRASDNCERDFRAKEVKDIATWVNTQTVPPLDLQELDADGHRTGDLVEAAAAYSLRNLSASYTGNVVDVRRSSDDAEESFTAAEVADGTLVTWVGAGNDGFVSQWYDQSGNDNHATQGTPARQPKIVDGGSLVSGGLDFDGVDDYLETTQGYIVELSQNPASVFCVATPDNTNEGYLLTEGDGTDPYSSNFILNGAAALNDVTAWVNTELFGSGFPASKTLGGFIYNETTFQAYLNGAADGAAGTAAVNPETSVQTYIAARADGTTSFFGGKVEELITYKSDQSDNRTAFEANIGETYGIDLPSGVDTGYDQVDGFVETWYDQSGNGNDATQSVSGSQPKIVDAGVLVSGGVDFDGVNDVLNTSLIPPSTATLIGVSNWDIEDVATMIIGARDSTNLRSYISQTSGGKTAIGVANGALDSIDVVASTDYLLFGMYSGADRLISVNSNPTSETILQDTPINEIYGYSIGALNTAGVDSAFMDGTIAEVIVYASDESANREAIEANINNQYDIY